MKNLLFFGLLLFCIEATCQDYLVKKDGTTIRGKMKTFASSRQRDYGAARGSGRSESFSSSSIEHISNATSDDDKGTLVINCASCAKKGRFEFVSRDGKSSSKISFETDENSDSFFPYRLKLDADRMYDWTYSDKNIGGKSGSIKLDAGAMMKFSGTLTILVDYKKKAIALSLRCLKLGIPKENLLM
nr:hypothetical protein [Spirosomataceae bacterium]